MLQPHLLGDALQALSDVLAARHLRYQLVAIGGSGLLLLGLIDRPTRDLDIVAVVEGGRYATATPLPEPLVEAVRDVGEALGLGPEWVNAGPAALFDLGLPEGFASRVVTRNYGALVLHVAGREDQIAFKLYAAVDQGPRSKHFQDLQRLAPVAAELVGAARWAITHDPSEGFRADLVVALARLGIENADAVL
jgi:hypothetical protein